MSGNQSLIENHSFYDDENDHEKTYVTINADSFNEKDFGNFLDCLDTLRASEKKRKGSKKVIKNYCVQVPYIDNSIVLADEDLPVDDFDKTCDEMKSNISQMFSYFEEDVHLNYDDYDKSGNEQKLSPNKGSVDAKKPDQNLRESFREKFLRNRNKIKEMGEAEAVDTKPIIRGVVKKWNAPSTPNSSLNKNQVDKIMNEFNRVKINYYSKDNYVEFRPDIDYFYCDSSDIESVRSEKLGKLKQNVLSKFEEKENDDDVSRKSEDLDVVPKNSVRDKIDMFTKLGLVIQPCGELLQKSISAPSSLKSLQDTQKRRLTSQVDSLMKNTSAANKNQNKCFIKDINNSLHNRTEMEDGLKANEELTMEENRYTQSLLHKIASYAQLNDIDLLLKLERIVNQFEQSLLHTLDALMSDDAFILIGNRMRHLNVETSPSIERFEETFVGDKIDVIMESFDLRRIEADMIQLQFHVKIVNRSNWTKDSAYINVIFMAQYETESTSIVPVGSAVPKNNFYIYFKSLFEVLKGIAMSNGCLIRSSNHQSLIMQTEDN